MYDIVVVWQGWT